MRKINRTLACVSLAALAVGFTTSARAQDAAASENDEEDVIIVTGSSLRGVAPVGSNLVAVSREDLESTSAQTVQQVLKTVPSVVGLQSAGQGSYGSFDGAGTNAPTIHGLGASASNSTLVLLNGHRLPVSGINHVLADPNIVAPLALERVEVLADGASSVYGSDAVAGVINFITRRDVDGFEATAQKGFGDNYSTFNAGVLWGSTWDSGSFLVTYNYSDRSNLAAIDRDWARRDQTARGGRNFLDNRCSPASITVGSGASAVTYYTPYGATSTTRAGDCDPTLYSDLLPSEERHSLFASVQQQLTDRLELTADFIYSNRSNVQNISRGDASGTIYATGSTPPAGRSINPFATILATLPGAPTSATVNFNGNQLLGPGATIKGTAETVYGRLDAVYEISDAWEFNVGGLVGLDRSSQFNHGQLNTATFNLALNGYTSASINGVTQSVSQALTSANAINVFGTGTSAATLAALADSDLLQVGDQTIRNIYARFNGDLFEIGGGTAKVAFGAEYIDYSLEQQIVRGNNLGGASTNSTQRYISYDRDVKSLYAELYLPLISDSFVESFEVILAGRMDDYSDFGSTTNPKIAANLEVIPGLTFRGNWGRSFVAPALTSRGANAAGLTGESGFSGITASQLPGGSPTVLIANFPNVTSVPGAVCGTTSCTIGTVSGILLTGGKGTLQPQKGEAWSIGVDFQPEFASGLNLSMTYWNNQLRGGITAPVPSLALGAADLSYLLQFYPAGATPTQIGTITAGLPQNGSLQPNTYFVYNFQQDNILNLNVAGIDVAASYSFDTDIGNFGIGATYTRKLKFDQFFGAGGTVFSVLGTAGFNTTFPSVKNEGRFFVNYDNGGFDFSFFVNHLGSYTNWSGSVANAVTRTNGVPTGGGDLVEAFTTVDLNVGYTFEDLGPMAEFTLFADVTNLFDTDPPQYNTFVLNGPAGYDNINASPIGRVVTVGLRTKF